MKIKYNDLIAVQMYGGNSCTICCLYGLGRGCIRDKLTDLGPCISQTKYYQHFQKSDIFEL